MFHFKLALRYLKGRHKIFFTFSNMLSMFGIIIGVFSLLVVSSVMNGFDSDMRRRVIGSKAEIKIHHADYSPISNYQAVADKIAAQEEVLAAAPVCESELMIQKGQNLSASVCFGIDFSRHRKITDLLDKIVVGVPEKEDLENDGIIIGLDLSLTINATVGEYVQLTSPIGTEPSPFGLLPRSKKLKVVGLFASGMPEYDQVYRVLFAEVLSHRCFSFQGVHNFCRVHSRRQLKEFLFPCRYYSRYVRSDRAIDCLHLSGR